MGLSLSSLGTDVRTRHYGTLHLRYISGADSLFLRDLAAQGLSPRQFAVQLLHHQLETPQLDLADAQAWPRSLLVRVARTWAANPHAFGADLPADMPPLAAFQQAAADYIAAEDRQMRETLDQMSSGRHWAAIQAGAFTSLQDHLRTADLYGLSHARSSAASLAAHGAVEAAREAADLSRWALTAGTPKVEPARTIGVISKLDQEMRRMACPDIKSTLVNTPWATSAISKLQQEALRRAAPDVGIKSAQAAALEVTTALQRAVGLAGAWDQGIGRIVAESAAAFSSASAFGADEGPVAASRAAADAFNKLAAIGLGSTQDHIASLVGSSAALSVQDRIAAMIADTATARHDALLDTWRTVQPKWIGEMEASIARSQAKWVGEMEASIARAEASARARMADLIGTPTSRWEFPSVLPPRPDPEVLRRRAEAMARGRQAIEAAGYGFAVGHMSVSFVLWAASLPPDEAPQAIRREAFAWTRSPDFEELLEDLFTQSPTLRRHWGAMWQTLTAHRTRLYVPAVCSTLRLIEGVFGDGLIIQDRAWGVRGKMYRADGDLVLVKAKRSKKGAPAGQRPPKASPQIVPKKQSRPEDRQELAGLTALVEWSGLMKDMAMRVLADLLLNRIAPDRNPILHGRWTSFGTPARSAQILLVLWVVALWVVGIERQLGQAAPSRRLN